MILALPTRFVLLALRTVIALLVALMTYVVTTLVIDHIWFRTSALFADARTTVLGSAALLEGLGTPIAVGSPLVWRGLTRSPQNAVAQFDISGPRGEATVYLKAKNLGVLWRLQHLEVSVEGDDAVLDLTPGTWHPQVLALSGAGRLYFVAIGKLSTIDVDELAERYSERFGVPIGVLSPLAHTAAKASARDLIGVLKAGHSDVVNDPQSVVIAFTEIPMDWYSWRDDDRFAVVSTASLTFEQFQKQVSKSLGLLWFELPMTADPRSVLFDDVESTLDLELMSDSF